MATDPDWVGIPPLDFEICGIDGSSLRFVARSVLAKRALNTGVISFEVTLTLRTPYSTFQHSFQCADYVSLRSFRNGLSALRNGSGQSAALSSDPFFVLRISLHKHGVREGLVVDGYYSSIDTPRHAPWPDSEQIGDVVLDSRSAGTIRFGFLSSVVDPPYVDDAIAQIDTIIRCLEEEGFQP